MIKDSLKNAKTYFNLSLNIKRALLWLSSANLDDIKEGRYIIDGDKIFANVQTYETKDSAPFEAHRKYIDIQYMIKGCENVGVTNYENCNVSEEYDLDKDLEFLFCNGKSDLYTLNQGEFLILYPQDAHQPSLNINNKSTVKKVVVKVAVD